MVVRVSYSEMLILAKDTRRQQNNTVVKADILKVILQMSASSNLYIPVALCTLDLMTSDHVVGDCLNIHLVQFAHIQGTVHRT